MKHTITAKVVVLAAVFCTTITASCAAPTPERILPSATLPIATTPAPTPSAEPSVTQPAATETPTQTKPAYPTSRPSTPLPNGDVTWGTGIEIHELDGLFDNGHWSPTRDEIVFFQDPPPDSHDVVLMRFAAPDFQPQEIRAVASDVLLGMEPCGYPDLLWSRDGQRIFFSGPQGDPSQGGIEPCSIWMVERDGKNPRRYYPEQKGRAFSPVGWIDDHTIILIGYREGFHVFDLLMGKTVNWASPRYFGTTFMTRDYLVGTNGEVYFEMYALGRRDEPFDGIMEDGPDNLRYALTPPPDSTYDWTGISLHGDTIAYDAIPGTNQVLGYWTWDVVQQKDSKIVKIIYVHKLVLWDIDLNTLTTLVPYGLWGRFSPDQRTLAYLTEGPAVLDAENRPIDPHSIDQFDWSALETKGNYLQLLDRSTGSIFLSVPVASQRDFADDEFLYVGANFSQDGQFLSFITNQKIVFDPQGWPEMVQPGAGDESGSHLYVLDLKNRRLIWDQSGLPLIYNGMEYKSTVESRLAIWSPKGNQFVFLDAENNPILVNLDTGDRAQITLRTSGRPVIQWAGSGEYIAVQIPDRYSWRVGIVKIP